MEKFDCFAYANKNCKALEALYCKNEDCKFFKTEEQFKADLLKAQVLLENSTRVKVKSKG